MFVLLVYETQNTTIRQTNTNLQVNTGHLKVALIQQLEHIIKYNHKNCLFPL